jgi:hypothetical protein
VVAVVAVVTVVATSLSIATVVTTAPAVSGALAVTGRASVLTGAGGGPVGAPPPPLAAHDVTSNEAAPLASNVLHRAIPPR